MKMQYGKIRKYFIWAAVLVLLFTVCQFPIYAYAEEVAATEAVKEEAVKEEAVKEETVKAETVTEEAVTEEAAAEELFTEETLTEESSELQTEAAGSQEAESVSGNRVIGETIFPRVSVYQELYGVSGNGMKRQEAEADGREAKRAASTGVILHRHTGGSGGGGCYGQYNERIETTHELVDNCPRHGECNQGDPCQYGCSCYFGPATSTGGGAWHWHCNCKVWKDITTKYVWYTINCGKTPDTLLAILSVTPSTTEWTKELILKAAYEIKHGSIRIPEQAFRWNNQSPVKEDSLSVSENGVYRCELQADGNADTAAGAVEVVIQNIDKTPPLIEAVQYDETVYLPHTTVSVNALDKQPDDTEGSGLHERAFSWDQGMTWVSENTKRIDKNGAYRVTVRDQVGNETSEDMSVSNLDDTPPVIIRQWMTPSFWTRSNVELGAEALDKQGEAYGIGLASKPYSWDDGETWTDGQTKEAAENGIYNVQIRDKFYHKTSTEFYVGNIDRIAPVIRSFTCSMQEGEEEGAMVTVDAYDAQSGLLATAYSWDHAKTWTSEHTVSASGMGSISVIVRDVAGNTVKGELVLQKPIPVWPEQAEVHIVENKENRPSSQRKIVLQELSAPKAYVYEKPQKVYRKAAVMTPEKATLIRKTKDSYNELLCALGILLIVLCLSLFYFYATARVYSEKEEGKYKYLGRVWIRKKEKYNWLSVRKSLLYRSDSFDYRIVLARLYVICNSENQIKIAYEDREVYAETERELWVTLL